MTKLTLAAALLAATTWGGTALAQQTLTMWYHGAGNDVEQKLIGEVIADFNASQTDWKVELQSFPQAAYNDSVVAGALAGNLPDILDVDGPNMPNWAWAGYMQPLKIDETKIAEFLPGTKGIWNGELYSIGLWDAAVAMVTRQSTLDALGLRTPTLDQPWTKDEFMDALAKAKASGTCEYALDLGMAWTGEWYPYAFSPFLQSFGGDIVDRSTYKTAEGALNGDAAMAFGEWWQSLFTDGYAQATQDPADRDGGFNAGKYCFSWNGNWAALGSLAAFDDVVFLPAPDFGNGPKIGAASWQFGVSAKSQHPEGAAAFIEFALQDKYLAAFSNGIGLIPATPSAAALTENYAPGGKLAVFFDLSSKQGLVRPVTPGYVVQAKVFEKAVADIANGADVAATLDAATDEINADIEKNNGYGH
ncbi:extracellular solute-binding protein [Neotabrizicola shimadae]|uniref:Extracellular solute-binding protein n=1 Tax=Neotabrizicola shimadae TaxID=2807096 RepID=A0A8G0ZQ24_9RHOB|nr:extracellular solute-binding protein [Neotabrizicola shimadae]QYZ69376.1 extracellular solute-binding protein [Neotabrizicola shimadae]